MKSKTLDRPVEQKSNRGRQSVNPKEADAKTFASKIFDAHEFGYRRLTIERPLRQSWQFSDERINELRFSSSRSLNATMKWVYSEYGESTWSDEADCSLYGVLKEVEDEIRIHIKANFSDMKEKDIKNLLDPKTWQVQKDILLLARQLQTEIGDAQCDDANILDDALKAACKTLSIKLESRDKKQIIDAVSWDNADAEKIIKKIHKGKANPMYGLFDATDSNGKAIVVEYKHDGDLRDNENVALDPSRSVDEVNEEYFAREVLPHVPDAWIDGDKKDETDEQVGIVGYEIPFNRHFYEYKPPRDLAVIDAELAGVSKEIMELLGEVGL